MAISSLMACAILQMANGLGSTITADGLGGLSAQSSPRKSNKNSMFPICHSTAPIYDTNLLIVGISLSWGANIGLFGTFVPAPDELDDDPA